jgi:hypothetical protein
MARWQKASWIDTLDYLPGLNLEEKARARVIILGRPREDRELYFEGTYAEAAAAIKALLRETRKPLLLHYPLFGSPLLIAPMTPLPWHAQLPLPLSAGQSQRVDLSLRLSAAGRPRLREPPRLGRAPSR